MVKVNETIPFSPGMRRMVWVVLVHYHGGHLNGATLWAALEVKTAAAQALTWSPGNNYYGNCLIGVGEKYSIAVCLCDGCA